jgi:hypothetical protein
MAQIRCKKKTSEKDKDEKDKDEKDKDEKDKDTHFFITPGDWAPAISLRHALSVRKTGTATFLQLRDPCIPHPSSDS